MAKINTASIDARIEKLQRLKELAEDPESAELLAEMFGTKATVNGTEPPIAKRTYKRGQQSRRVHRRKDKPSEIVLTVMSQEHGKSTKEIAEALKAKGFDFKG